MNKNGFYNPKIGKAASGAVVVELENTAYHGNILDAAGVALGLMAAAHVETGQYFELIISSRGIRQLLIRANAACVKKWLEADDWCEKFEIKSLNNQKYDDSDVAWSEGSRWHFRPEIILSPTLISTLARTSTPCCHFGRALIPTSTTFTRWTTEPPTSSPVARSTARA